jgi:hypothetical protein
LTGKEWASVTTSESGNSQTGNSQTGNSENGTTTTTHIEENRVINNVVTLWGNPDTGICIPGSLLAPGQRQFPFQFEIPPDLPASFEFKKVARIRYKLEAYLDIPLGMDIMVKVPLQMGLNVTPEMRQPFDAMRSTESSKTVCCLCFSRGDIHTKLVLPSTVLYLNFSRPLQGTVTTDNFSSRNCTKATISITQHVKFSACHR